MRNNPKGKDHAAVVHDLIPPIALVFNIGQAACPGEAGHPRMLGRCKQDGVQP